MHLNIASVICWINPSCLHQFKLWNIPHRTDMQLLITIEKNFLLNNYDVFRLYHMD